MIYKKGEWYISFNGDLIITNNKYQEILLKIPKNKIKEFEGGLKNE